MGRWLLALADLIDEPLTIIDFSGKGQGPTTSVRSWSLVQVLGPEEPLTLMVFFRGGGGGQGGKDQQFPFLVFGLGTLESYCVFVKFPSFPLDGPKHVNSYLRCFIQP